MSTSFVESKEGIENPRKSDMRLCMSLRRSSLTGECHVPFAKYLAASSKDWRHTQYRM